VTVLSGWRDAALILLSLEVLLPGAAVGLVLYQTVHGMAQLRQKLLPWLFRARLVTWQICGRVNRAMHALAAPFVWLHSLAAGFRRALQVLGWG
jgi:hypothetical protein